MEKSSVSSIVEYAKKLEGHTLREMCGMKKWPKGKGKFGQSLEEFYFKYNLNNKSKPDFEEAGVEVKSTPLKIVKGKYRSKERIVLNVINFQTIYQETFYTSSFWKKNAKLLIIFYLFEENKEIWDYLIKFVVLWEYSEKDLLIIKDDWEFIKHKIINRNAHKLSEGDTYYLGACTKGQTAKKSMIKQFRSETEAKRRAYSLKQGYVNMIIQNILRNKNYKEIISFDSLKKEKLTFEEIIIKKFQPFLGKTPKEIEKKLNCSLNIKAKSYFSMLTKKILNVDVNQEIEEFTKASIEIKTIRIKEDGLPKEHISFPAFKFKEIIKEDWEDSKFKSILEKKFLFVFFQYKNGLLFLKKARFWNMPFDDINIAKKVWDSTIEIINSGKVIKTICKNGRIRTNFPKQNENNVAHVRPHALNKKDHFPLPVQDVLTKFTSFTKHCFWLNAKYVRDEIFLKDTKLISDI